MPLYSPSEYGKVPNAWILKSGDLPKMSTNTTRNWLWYTLDWTDAPLIHVY